MNQQTRVVRVAIKGKNARPSELDAATTPVASRLLRALRRGEKGVRGGALESEKLRGDMKDVLLGVGRLWKGLREKSMGAATRPPGAL